MSYPGQIMALWVCGALLNVYNTFAFVSWLIKAITYLLTYNFFLLGIFF